MDGDGDVANAEFAGPKPGATFDLREAMPMDGMNRADIRPGAQVAIVQKQDQRSGRLTEGVVRDLLTKSPTHPHGIKVRLETGEVGRVKEVREP